LEEKRTETLSLEEQIVLLADSVEEGFRERLNQAIKELAEILQPIVDTFLEAFNTVFDENNGKEVVEQAIAKENSRVVYLALNHRKERVRKKNMKRFKKIVEKHRNLKK
jgi:oligoendopeptidase F